MRYLKHTNKIKIVLGLVIGLVFVAEALGTDWPHWRGPFLNGSTDEKNLPSKFSQTENIAWAVNLPGPGSATPIVSKGRVFVSSSDNENKGSFLALCLDAESGKELWRKELAKDKRNISNNNMASPSPVTDGKTVFFMYGSGDLAALDYKGSIIWSRNLEEEYGNITLKFGYSSAPLLYKDKLYILIQRRNTAYREPKGDGRLDSFLLAVDPKTGENIWKMPRKTDAVNESLDSYSSPIIFRGNGRDEIVIAGGDYVTGQDPETGKEYWRFGYNPGKKRNWRNVPSCVPGEGLVFAVKPRGGDVLAFKGGGSGELSGKDLAWSFDGPAPDAGTPAYYKGRLYVLDEARHGKALTCIDPRTGRQLWQGKLGGQGPYYASMTAADGKIYCINESGEVVIVSADDKEFKIIFRIKLEDEPCRSSIAIADGHLFIRTAKKLYCVGD